MRSESLVVQVRGVVLPTWVALALVASFFAGGIVLAGGAFMISRAERELRILQLHVSDMQSAMIRAGLADRRDFVNDPAKKE